MAKFESALFVPYGNVAIMQKITEIGPLVKDIWVIKDPKTYFVCLRRY